jgi:hypothetical protein
MFGLSYSAQIWLYRVLFFAGPVIAALLAYRTCVELQRGEQLDRRRKLAERAARTARRRA